ncbi:mechanosensitive ion channel [bacterium AH-315-M05]|nr:mechanosensitive ion channel [bacterium AH-315-M05]
MNIDEITDAIQLQATLYLPKIIMSIVVVIAFLILSRILKKIIMRFGQKRSFNKDVLNLIAKTLHVILLIMGIISALGTLGIDVSAIVAGLGLTGFALGFALKDAISNILAGSLILIYRPFNRNDTIKVSNNEGVVEEIDLRYTTLKAEGKKILIPNATLLTNVVIVIKEGE